MRNSNGGKLTCETARKFLMTCVKCGFTRTCSPSDASALCRKCAAGGGDQVVKIKKGFALPSR